MENPPTYGRLRIILVLILLGFAIVVSILDPAKAPRSVWGMPAPIGYGVVFTVVATVAAVFWRKR